MGPSSWARFQVTCSRASLLCGILQAVLRVLSLDRDWPDGAWHASVDVLELSSP